MDTKCKISNEDANVTDPRWKDHTLFLVEYLQEPRSWSDLEVWSKSNRVNPMILRQQLAWLSFNEIAVTFYAKAPKDSKDNSDLIRWWVRK